MLGSSGVQISSAIVKLLVVSIPGLLTSLYIYSPLGKGEPHPSALFAHQGALWANNSLEVACTSQSPTLDTSVQGGGEDKMLWLKKRDISSVPSKYPCQCDLLPLLISSSSFMVGLMARRECFLQDISTQPPPFSGSFCSLPSFTISYHRGCLTEYPSNIMWPYLILQGYANDSTSLQQSSLLCLCMAHEGRKYLLFASTSLFIYKYLFGCTAFGALS